MSGLEPEPRYYATNSYDCYTPSVVKYHYDAWGYSPYQDRDGLAPGRYTPPGTRHVEPYWVKLGRLSMDRFWRMKARPAPYVSRFRARRNNPRWKAARWKSKT